MSDLPPVPPMPMMTPEKARDIGCAHKAWASYLADQGLTAEAARAERDSAWWLTYSIALAQTKPDGEAG
jgi:hypothetical protein